MFWASLSAGAAVLLSWKIWVSILIYLFVSFLPLALAAGLFSAVDSGSGAAGAGGCLFSVIGRPLLQGVFVSFFVIFTLPLMLGSTNATPLADVITMAWPITKAGLIASVAVTVLCFIPIVGDLIANSIGIQTFMMGVIVFRLFFGVVEEQLALPENAAIYPSLWGCLGYLAISGVVVWALTMLGALVGSFLEGSGHDSASAGFALVFGPLFGIVGGFLPLFMFVQYVELAIRASQNQ